MKEPIRVLYVSSEICPYLPESTTSKIGRYLPQGIQERGYEIRSFMPKYGVINERRNQLHEVIRLSGMNIVINDLDRPLIIKVSSIPSARMQVYFIDNEDYFYRKHIYNDDDGAYFEDNDERALFFARGVLETVKKLRWQPDIIHCQGWITHFLPMYLKKSYSDDPIFSNTKVVTSLDEIGLDQEFSQQMKSKITQSGVKSKDIDIMSEFNGINLAKLALKYSDGVIKCSTTLPEDLEQIIGKYKLPVLEYIDTEKEDSSYIDEYKNFYDKITE
jgi:starch synthase